jgi:hypothetical protein
MVRTEAILVFVFLGRGELCDRHDEKGLLRRIETFAEGEERYMKRIKTFASYIQSF